MFVSVKFREGDSRTYTYTCDLERAPEIGEAVLVEVGDRVQAGQVLGEIDPVELDERVSAQESSLKRNQAARAESVAEDTLRVAPGHVPAMKLLGNISRLLL